ncbi:hypothetical protein FA95DRAFT_1539834 [Auriscalpium vulgare]|uniref:Uncharacterized protein n=1 Tax=Auriscalpium vulgare TaxID=40419 RepID=A0ACB8RWZ7_9AGAM|nr:hypothetical protein FA95DRAFT_1539834 [Auriscalpium vulgare]
MSGRDKRTVLALYRSTIRQVNLLPHIYLRQFFRIKVADDFRPVLASKHRNAYISINFKRLRKESYRLELANSGHQKALAHVLDLAYGRKGPLKWSILTPLLRDSHEPVPRIISTVERSRPPAYSPALTALVTSPMARENRAAIHPRNLKCPPGIPPRADPASEEARLFGPFSKRRLVNIHWRYYKEHKARVLPPLELSSQVETNQPSHHNIGLQGTHILQELKELAGPLSLQPPAPRRQIIRDPPRIGEEAEDSPQPIFNRYLRRRYRELLGRTPILTVSSRKPDVLAKTAPPAAGEYTVSLATNAISVHSRHEDVRARSANAVDEAWMKVAEGEGDGGTFSGPNKRQKQRK